MIKQAICTLKDIVSDESGATAIEYSIVAAGISMVIIGFLTFTGTYLSDVFMMVADGLL